LWSNTSGAYVGATVSVTDINWDDSNNRTVALPKRVEDVPGKKSPDDRYCSEHYRSYDPASRTYMGYDGQRRSCR
jgi:hypothetical protein